MKTEAFLLTQKGTPEKAFKLSTIKLKELTEDEVLIEVEAFGLNYADVMARLGLYRDAPPFPCVIGYEVVGKIVQVGNLKNEHLLQKRVVAFTRFGAYARHTITSVDAVSEIGEIASNEALALTTQGTTAYYMTNYTTHLNKGENVLIHAAAGGVGTLLIQFAKLSGARVIAKVSSKEKEAICLKLGADYTINYRLENYVEAIERKIGKKQLAVSFNPVGGSTYKKDHQLLGFGSKIILFGGSELSNGKWGMFSQLNFIRKMGITLPIAWMMQSKSMIGVNMLKIADYQPLVLKQCLQEVVALYQANKLIIQQGGNFTSDQLFEAHNLLESGKSIGKIAIHWNSL